MGDHRRYGVHAIWPSAVAGTGGGDAPTKIAQLRVVPKCVAVAPQPEALTPLRVTVTPADVE